MVDALARTAPQGVKRHWRV